MSTDVDLAPRGGTADDSERSADPEEHADITLKGLEPDDLTGEFLAAVMDVAEAHGLAVDGISVNRHHE